MSHLRSYPEYRDSGVGWLGHIPYIWQVIPLCRMFRRIKRTGYPDRTLLSVYRDHGVVDKDSRDDNFNRASDDLTPYQLVMPGDLVTNKMKTWQGSIAVSTIEGIVSPAYYVYAAEHGHNPAYIHYLLRSAPYVAGYLSASKGIRVNQWDLDDDLFRQFPVLVPSRPEQDAIVSLIENETTRIDTLIQKKIRFIELLKEKRQALITHAVTKGLNPDTPMKDSGIEWLGEVPAHWTTPKLKHVLAEPITDGPHETPIFLDEGIPFVSAEAVGGGFVDFCRIRGFISEEDHARFSKKYRPRAHDIFMVKSGATTGVTAIVESDTEFNIWSPLAAMRCSEKVAPKFLLYFLRSIPFQDAIALSWSFGTQQNIGMGVLGNMSVVLPPPGEQLKILAFLAMQCGKTEDLLSKTGHSIALLQERRSALITAAVTGKIDLRDAA